MERRGVRNRDKYNRQKHREKKHKETCWRCAWYTRVSNLWISSNKKLTKKKTGLLPRNLFLLTFFIVYVVKEDMPIERDTLRAYYERIFPIETLYQWMSYGSADTARCREISFASGDFVKRFMTFPTPESLKQELLRSVPDKIDLGAVFSHPCEKKQGITLVPMQRELVFDIDISDYDNVRACCDGKTICRHCWTLIAGAVRAVTDMLLNDFGYEQFFWVYSGRRGVHCWVCDPSARMLTNDERVAVVSYMSSYEGGSEKDGSAFTVKDEPELRKTKGWLHPAVRAVLDDRLKLCFKNTYYTHENANDVRTNEKTRAALTKYLTRIVGSRDKGLDKLIASCGRDSYEELMHIAGREGLEWAMEAAVLAMTFPRLDVNVSKQRNHLLKSPWVVHPGTGKVCVPLDVEAVEEFDPETDAPNVAVLVAELQRGNPVPLDGLMEPMIRVIKMGKK